jgi:hypothetical protein
MQGVVVSCLGVRERVWGLGKGKLCQPVRRDSMVGYLGDELDREVTLRLDWTLDGHLALGRATSYIVRAAGKG